jgi:hypothetical protein
MNGGSDVRDCSKSEVRTFDAEIFAAGFQRCRQLGVLLEITSVLQLMESLMVVLLVVSLMEFLLGYPYPKPICNRTLTGGIMIY